MYIFLTRTQKSCSISIMQRTAMVCTTLLRAGQTTRIYIHFSPFVLLCLLISMVPSSFIVSLGELRRYLFLSFLSQKSHLSESGQYKWCTLIKGPQDLEVVLEALRLILPCSPIPCHVIEDDSDISAVGGSLVSFSVLKSISGHLL